MAENEGPEALRAKARARRTAADNQEADIKSGNFPRKLDKHTLLEHVARLRSEADELENRADSLEKR